MLTKIALAVSLLVVIAGCGEKPAETAAPDTGSSTQTTAPAAQSPTGAKATMAKCEACGNEVFADELKLDHGKMTCKKCVESHGH